MHRKIHFTTGIIAGMIFLTLFNFSAYANNCEKIRNNTLRLHIIAESDNEADQKIKLQIRDAVLESSPDIFDGSITIENAKEKILPEIDNIRKTADRILEENGFDYKSEVILTDEYFDTRVYKNNITLPAGKYLALKIILGEGKGKNWWCVMFPALCLPIAENNENYIATFYSDEEKDIITNTSRYEIRFKISESIEKIKNMVDIKLFS